MSWGDHFEQGLSQPRYAILDFLFNTPTFKDESHLYASLQTPTIRIYTHYREPSAHLELAQPPFLHEQLAGSCQACRRGMLSQKELDGRFSSLTHPDVRPSKLKIPAAPTRSVEILPATQVSRCPDLLARSLWPLLTA